MSYFEVLFPRSFYWYVLHGLRHLPFEIGFVLPNFIGHVKVLFLRSFHWHVLQICSNLHIFVHFHRFLAIQEDKKPLVLFQLWLQKCIQLMFYYPPNIGQVTCLATMPTLKLLGRLFEKQWRFRQLWGILWELRSFYQLHQMSN